MLLRKVNDLLLIVCRITDCTNFIKTKTNYSKGHWYSHALYTNNKAPFTLLLFHMKKEQNLSVLGLSSHCSAVKTELFENANENA